MIKRVSQFVILIRHLILQKKQRSPTVYKSQFIDAESDVFLC